MPKVGAHETGHLAQGAAHAVVGDMLVRQHHAVDAIEEGKGGRVLLGASLRYRMNRQQEAERVGVRARAVVDVVVLQRLLPRTRAVPVLDAHVRDLAHQLVIHIEQKVREGELEPTEADVVLVRKDVP